MARTLDGRELLERTLEWLARTAGILRAHVQGQSSQTLERRPGGKAWSQAEILAHLADYEVVCFQDRIERILRGESFRSLDPEKRAAEIPYAVINPFTSLEVFAQERERSLARIRQLSPDQLERRALHRGKGEMTLARLLTEWVDHDLSHVRQLVATAAQTLQPVTELESRAPGPMGTSGRAVMIL
jgi:uncharacterized damage-inducible protein DinB